jgi:outer membrane immunogenic protein
MKKTFMIVSLLATSILLQAQLDFDSLELKKKKKCEPRLLMRAAINFSSIGGDSESYQGLLPGAQLGVGTPLAKLSRNTAVFVEALYSMQGSSYEEGGSYEPGGGGGGSYNYEGKVKLSYINFPITARYQSPGGFFGEAGIQPGILVGAKDKVGGNSNNYKDHLNTFDLGVVVGAGFQFNDNIGVGVRATPGITNINKKRPGYDGNKDRNFVLSLGAVYTL